MKARCTGRLLRRCLESLYYLGVQAAKGLDPVFVDQWAPYGSRPDLSYKEALGHLIGYLEEQGEAGWKATTQLIIIPGFSFRATDALITNFHQPGSTLLLLVAALVGVNGKKYTTMLGRKLPFLSYGDTCLLFNLKAKNQINKKLYNKYVITCDKHVITYLKMADY